MMPTENSVSAKERNGTERMTFRSADSFRAFDRVVRREFRFLRPLPHEEFLKAVAATSHSRSLTLKFGFMLWRAQIGHDWEQQREGSHSVEVRVPHPPLRMKPLVDRASDGRANPKGIPCLYLATKQETAVLEVRPGIGSYLSVAEFMVLRDLQLVDCSADGVGDFFGLEGREWTSEDIEKQVWSDINKAFSRPVERGDDSLDYIPTQIITEIFKLTGFDGIAYRSSYGKDGFNVALFDVEAANVATCSLHRIDDVSVTFSERANPYFVRDSFPLQTMRDTDTDKKASSLPRNGISSVND